MRRRDPRTGCGTRTDVAQLWSRDARRTTWPTPGVHADQHWQRAPHGHHASIARWPQPHGVFHHPAGVNLRSGRERPTVGPDNLGSRWGVRCHGDVQAADDPSDRCRGRDGFGHGLGWYADVTPDWHGTVKPFGSTET